MALSLAVVFRLRGQKRVMVALVDEIDAVGFCPDDHHDDGSVVVAELLECRPGASPVGYLVIIGVDHVHGRRRFCRHVVLRRGCLGQQLSMSQADDPHYTPTDEGQYRLQRGFSILFLVHG